MSKNFSSAVESRRSIYGIDAEIKISPERVAEIVKHSVKHAPSAFNSQTARALVLSGDHHKKLWEATKEILRAMVPAANFAPTEAKINSFRAGAGTVLFFEEQTKIAELQEKFPTYADRFPLWSLQSSGMAQFVVWTALEDEGLGASLQHYSPLVDEFVQTEWKIPGEWKLLSQLVFGNPIAAPAEKIFAPIDERVIVFV